MGLVEGGLCRQDGGARRGVWREAAAEQGGGKQEAGGEIIIYSQSFQDAKSKASLIGSPLDVNSWL